MKINSANLFSLIIFFIISGFSCVEDNLEGKKLYHWEYQIPVVYAYRIHPDGRKKPPIRYSDISVEEENRLQQLEDQRIKRWKSFEKQIMESPKQLDDRDIKEIYEIFESEKIQLNKPLTKEILYKYMPEEAYGVHLTGLLNPNTINGRFPLLIKGALFDIIDNNGFGMGYKKDHRIKTIYTMNPYFKTPEAVHPDMSLKEAIKYSIDGLHYNIGYWGLYLKFPSGWKATLFTGKKNLPPNMKAIKQLSSEIKVFRVFLSNEPEGYEGSDNYHAYLGYLK